ncbi:YybH family protein [Fulvivirga imtechensis]|nr:nuclear transport factor 2 family protein [Fulvivirga imtechensis]
MKRLTLFLMALAMLTVCEAQKRKQVEDPLAEARQAIEKSNAIYFQAFVKGDSSIFIERYAKDCCIMAPNAPAKCGPDAALAFYRIAYHQFGLRDGRFITQEIFGDGKEFVTEVGLWESYNANGELYDHGKFMVLWKKTQDGWKMFRDSFSSNRN